MNKPGHTQASSPIRRFALTVGLAYVALAGVWIFASDRMLAALAPDAATLSALQTWKGWGFVAITGLLLYFVILRRPADPEPASDGVPGDDRRVGRIVTTVVAALMALILANLAYTIVMARQVIQADTERIGTGESAGE